MLLAGAVLARHQAEIRLQLMRAGEPVGSVDRGDERGGGDRTDAGGAAQASDARIRTAQRLELSIGLSDLRLQRLDHGKHRRDRLLQWFGESHRLQAGQEGRGPADRQGQSLLPKQRPDEDDVTRPGAHQSFTHGDAGAHPALLLAGPVRRPVGPQPARLGQGTGIPPVGLHLPLQPGIHRSVVRVGDDDLMAEIFQAPGHPLALGPRLEQDACPSVVLQSRREPFPLGPDPPFDQLASLRQNADLAVLPAEVYANMIHGWSSWLCASERVTELSGASLFATTSTGDQPLHLISLARDSESPSDAHGAARNRHTPAPLPAARRTAGAARTQVRGAPSTLPA